MRYFPRSYAMLTCFFLGVFASPSGQAYPIIIRGQDAWMLQGAARSHLIAMVPSNDTFKTVGLQFDEMEDDAMIVFRGPEIKLPIRETVPHPKDKDPFNGAITRFHRIVVDEGEFAPCDNKCTQKARAAAAKLCAQGVSDRFVKIQLIPDNRVGFLAECLASTPFLGKIPVRADVTNRTFSGPIYSYKYKSDKNIMIDKISLTQSGQEILSSSELAAYLRPRFMFNVTIAEDDIHSQVSAVASTPLATAAELTTAVDVVGLGSSNQVCCDMTFFKDAFYYPVVIQLPFSGSSFSKGSGMFFGLTLPPEIEKTIEYQGPRLRESGKSGGSAAVLTLTAGDEMLTIGFRGAKADKGEYILPQLAHPQDLDAFKFAPKITSRFGFFYDIRRLSSGIHHFDVWFFIGKKSDRERLIRYAQHGIKFSLELL